MAAAALSAARDSASPRIETYGRPRAGGAVRGPERFRFPTPAVAWRAEAGPHQAGPGVRFKVSSAGERMGRRKRRCARQVRGSRLDVRCPRFGLLPGRKEVKMFVGLGWSFDKPEASDASWGGSTGGVLKFAPPSAGKS